MNIKEYIMYKNNTHNPGSAWVNLIQSSDEYMTLAQGKIEKGDPLYTKYAKILYDDVNNFFEDLDKEINLSSDVYDILIFIANMGDYCTPFITKKVISKLNDILGTVNFNKHVDVIFSVLMNKFIVNALIDDYIKTSDAVKLHRFLFIANTYNMTNPSFTRHIRSVAEIVKDYEEYLMKKNVDKMEIQACLHFVNRVRNI